MILHFKRFGWVYLVLCVLCAWPVYIWRQQSVPPADVATMRRVAVILQNEYARTHPGLTLRGTSSKEFAEMFGQSNDFPKKLGARGFRIAELVGPAAAAPALAPDLDWVKATIDPMIKPWIDAAAHHVAFYPFAAEGRTSASALVGERAVPNFLALQTMSKTERALAEAAIAGQRWDEALARLEDASHIGDTVYYSSLIGYLIDVATRAIAYGGWETLLHSGAPPDVQRKALDAIVALRVTEPVLDEWAMATENAGGLQMSLYRLQYKTKRNPLQGIGIEDPMARVASLWNAAGYLIQHPGNIHDPKLEAWAEEFAKSTSMEFGVPTLIPGKLKWTTLPAARKWLGEMIEKEPWIYHNSLIPESEYKNLDPWTLLMTFPMASIAMANYQEASVRGRIVKTRGRLLEAAFAARLYKEKHGVWPKDVAELGEIYTPLKENADPTTWTAAMDGPAYPTTAYQPIRIAEHPMTPELRSLLWAGVLPIRVFNNPANLIKAGGVIDYLSTFPNDTEMREPLRLIAVEQALRAHPRLVESAQALMSSDDPSRCPPDSANPMQPPNLASWMHFKPLDPAPARRVTDATDREMAPSANAPVTSETIRAVRLTAKLKAPEKAMVIWAPGPMGVDEGGKVSYDPTNGTTSVGDLIVFPEEY